MARAMLLHVEVSSIHDEKMAAAGDQRSNSGFYQAQETV